MRNLRKYLALAIAIAMMLTAFPVLGAGAFSYGDQADDLNKLGLYAGVGQGSFDPALDRELTRQEAAVMVVRLFGVTLDVEAEKLPSVSEARGVVSAKFSDANEIADWAVRHVAYGIENGYINGYPDGTFKPAGPLVGRAYCTMIIANLDYEFAYEDAGDVFAEAAAIFDGNEIELFGANEKITRDTLVGITYRALDAYYNDQEKNIAATLVEKGAVEKVLFDDMDIPVTGLADVNPTVAPTVAPTVEPTVEPTTEPTVAPSGEPTTEPTVEPTVVPAGTVAVEWMPQQSRSVATSQALVHVGSITLTSDEDLTVTGLEVSRSGLSKDNDVEGITVWDGTTKLNVSSTLSDGVAEIGFTKAVQVKAGEEKVLDIKATIAASGTATVAAQVILAVSAVTAPSNVTVTGDFPMTAGVLTIADVALGSLTVSVSSDAPTTNINAATTDVRLAKFDLVAASEDITVKQITLTQNGSVADSDVENLRLYNGSTQVGEAANLTDRVVTFMLDELVESGDTLRLTVKGDVVGGAGRTVQFDIDDTVEVQGMGSTYGTIIVASFAGSASTLTGNTLSINQGSLIITRDETSPSAGTISTKVDDQEFAVMKVEAIGEPIQLRKIRLVITTTGASAGDVTDIKIAEVNSGKTISTDADLFGSNVAGTFTAEVSLDKTLDVTPGVPALLSITGDFDGFTANQTVKIGLDGGAGIETINGRGLVSSKTVTGNVASDNFGNVMTVGDLSVDIDRVPADDEYAFQNESGMKMIEFDISHNLAEAVEVSQVSVAINDNATVTNTNDIENNITNLKMVDAQGNVISDVITNLTDNVKSDTVVFSLNNPVIVDPGATVRVGVVGDVISDAFNTDDYYFGANAASVARTVKSGTTVTVNPETATTGKLVTISSGGAKIAITRSSTVDVKSENVYAGDSDVVVAAYNLVSDATDGKEAAVINKIKMAPIGVRESLDITINALAGAAVATDTVTVTLPDLADTGTISFTTVPLAGGETPADIATAIKAAFDLHATASTIYDMTDDLAAKLTITRRDSKDITDIVAGNFVANQVGGGSTFAWNAGGNTLALTQGEMPLESQYVSNLRVVDTDGTVYASISNLGQAKEINFTTPFVVPSKDAATNTVDRSKTLKVIADFTADAPYGKKYAIRLGDNDDTTKDVTYQAQKTGVDGFDLLTLDLPTGPSSADAIFTTGGTKLTVVDKTATNVTNAAGMELARFELKNEGTRPIIVTELLVYDLAGSFNADNAVSIYKADGTVLINGAFGALDGTTAANIADISINPGKSQEIVIRADAALVGNGTANFKVYQGTAAAGTTYQVLNDTSVSMTLFDDYILNSVSIAN